MIHGGYSIAKVIPKSSTRLVLVLMATVLVGCCWGQNCSSAVVPLNVLTKDGSVIRSITPEQLSVEVHGKKARVVSFNLDTSPRRVVLLVDTSGSMTHDSSEGWRLVARPKFALWASRDRWGVGDEESCLKLAASLVRTWEHVEDYSFSTPDEVSGFPR